MRLGGATCVTVRSPAVATRFFRVFVAADHFDLDAKLGFLLGAFSKTIENEIEKNLDALLAKSAAEKKPAANKAAKK